MSRNENLQSMTVFIEKYLMLSGLSVSFLCFIGDIGVGHFLSMGETVANLGYTVISRNFARAIIVFKHHFSPALNGPGVNKSHFKTLKRTQLICFI